MKKMIVGLSLAGCAMAAHAEASTASIVRLLQVSGTSQMMDNMKPHLEKMMRESFKDLVEDKSLSPKQQRVMDAWPAKFAKLMGEEMSWPQMEPDVVRIYQESFDQAEIDGLIAFYESPTGKSMVQKMPLVMAKSAEMSQRQMQRLMPKMKALMEDTRAEMERAE